MAPLVSKIAVLGNRHLDWLSELDSKSYQIDTIPLLDHDFSAIAEKQYHLLLLDDEISQANVEEILVEINRSQPLVSVIILSQNTDPDYILKLIERGADDVFDLSEEGRNLTRRLNLAIKRNYTKRMTMRHNRNLNSVTVLSRRLHNANHPNNLIVDALDIVSSTFDLLGLAIVLESGNQYHFRAGNSAISPNKRIYDVMIQLHAYDPIRQSIDKGIVIVFEDLSLNEYIADIPIFEKLHSAIIVPLRYVNITLGAILALGTEANPLTRDDIVIYEHLATHLGSAYQNVRHFHTQDVNARASLHLLRTWQRLSSVYTVKQVDETVQLLASEISGVKNTLVWLYTESSDQLVTSASNSTIVAVFQKLYALGVINEYLNQFDTQMQPLIIWLGRSNTRDIGELFQVMEGQQLILVPIKDAARLLGCILVSSNSNEQMGTEYISLLEGIAHAAGQTLERNMLISYKDRQTERLEAITRSIKDGVFFVADRQDVVFCNPQFTELTGISPLQVLNKPVQSLLDELVNESDNPVQTRQQLNNAIHQIKGNSIDQEYPIVEIHIPKVETRFYVEFIALPLDNGDEQQSWVGVLRSSDHVVSSPAGLSSSVTTTMVEHLLASATDVHSNLALLNNNGLPTTQANSLKVAKTQSQELEQLLSNAQTLLRLNQPESLDLTWNDPNKLLSVILNKPPLRGHNERLDIRTSIKDTKIQVDKQYLMRTLTNMVEVALQLSDDDSPVQIQMGAQANRFIFRLLSKGQDLLPEQINQMLEAPYSVEQDISYAIQLRLFISNQVITRHEGQLLIKKSPSQGMQFNIMLPLSEEITEDSAFDEKIERIPERKLSTVMIYDDNLSRGDVDYDFLKSHQYDLIYCTQLEQVYNEVDMVRVDLIILTVREQNELFLNLVERLRQQKNITTPILVLSTYNAEEIRIRSLKTGVDAYIGLPISNEELLAQIENLFERSKLPERVREPLSIGKLRIDFAQRQVALESQNLDLTRIEYELLCQLALKMGQTLTHSELLTEVWGPEYKEEKQYLWVNMSRLRRKLENSQDKTRYIFTQPGVGYILRDAT